MKFICNMSGLDRAVRAVFGAVFLYLPFSATPLVADAVIVGLLAAFGLVNIGSALVGHCPVYRLANLSTTTLPSRE